MKNYSAIRAISPHIADILVELAFDRIQVDANSEDSSALLASGLVKASEDGILVMPPFVKQTIQKTEI